MCHDLDNPKYTETNRCSCGCCECGCCSFRRRYFSAKEELECLEKYRQQLKKELEAVDEYIKKLKGK
ncbi:MAG: hypothetical protein A2Y62_11285 [Candidatus Fischerbacteria bacterium RBG_13_37_8]|uniref:Uncharacterized protein n=1 Tax=Candidatus Fischerbacteria bacterium RBG_13_37_8 TaxID=1817863 RepID=A0A1F5VWF3_9BACT|nr:MAG: hypothetical protein A2Y62_11285 [Candidatus Fischerbacteria bacterium RBG_13_37_8]